MTLACDSGGNGRDRGQCVGEGHFQRFSPWSEQHLSYPGGLLGGGGHSGGGLVQVRAEQPMACAARETLCAGLAQCPGVWLAQAPPVSGPGPSRCGVRGGWHRMFTLFPTDLPAGSMLDLVLRLFISPTQCRWEPSTFSSLPNSPGGRPVSCREKRLGRWGCVTESLGPWWHTVSMKVSAEGRERSVL